MPIFQVKKFSQMSHHEEPLWLEIIASFHFQKIVVLTGLSTIVDVLYMRLRTI